MKHILGLTLALFFSLFVSCDWGYQLYIENGLQDTIKVELYANEYSSPPEGPKVYSSTDDIPMVFYENKYPFDSSNKILTIFLAPGEVLHFGDFYSFQNREETILNSQITISISDSLQIKDYELINYYERSKGRKQIFLISSENLSNPKDFKWRHLAFVRDTVLISIRKNNPRPVINYLPDDRMIVETVYMFGKPYYRQTFIKGEQYSFTSFYRNGNIKFERYYRGFETILKREYYRSGQLKYIYDAEKELEEKFNKKGARIE